MALRYGPDSISITVKLFFEYFFSKLVFCRYVPRTETAFCLVRIEPCLFINGKNFSKQLLIK